MSANEVWEQLESIAAAADFPYQSAEIVEKWKHTAFDSLDTVESILRFMEKYPPIDVGAPGALVHFVERYYGKGYEEKLLESIRRKPTEHTVVMLNRVVNGTKVPEVRQALVAVLKQAGANPLADVDTRHLVNHFLQRLSTI